MLKQKLRWVMGKTEPTEKIGKLNQCKIHVSSFLSVNRNRISAFAIMKQLKNGCHFINIDRNEKFQITNPLPKVWVSSFLSVDGNGISVPAIMKQLKNGYHFSNIDHTEKFQITDYPKVWVSGFVSVDGNGISVSAIMKQLKNGCHFIINHMEKFQITDCPKVWVSGFLFWVLMETEYHQKTRNANFLFSPRFHFNIYAWLHLKHLCVNIDPTSHLCVVLHFLIFSDI